MRGRNFLLTMLRLAREKDEMRVVADQHGAPTWSRTIAETTAQIIAQSKQAPDQRQWWLEKSGVYHLTAQGQTTWHGFAKHILDTAVLEKKPSLHAIETKDYPTPAIRPAYSVLSNQKLAATFGLQTPDWAHDVHRCLSAA
jgi:dTDP-4-dehydrorhamnose reductase